MLRRIDDFYLVSEKDLIIALKYATYNNDTIMKNILNKLFIDMGSIITVGSSSYHKTNDINLIDYLITKVKIKNYETYIDYNVLSSGYIIAKYENNHEMSKKIYSYLIKYLTNEINGLSNEVLTNEIINDKNTLKYLKKYDNLDDFVTSKVNKNVSLIGAKENVKKKRIA